MSTVATPKANSRQELIESKIDRAAASGLMISREAGGIAFANMGEVMELAKLMAVSQHAVPPHCRNNPGLCLGLAIQSIEWRMSPFAVASKSYVVNDRLSYESQLIHAVIEQRAPIASRLRHRFIGAGAKRQCIVWATAKGEADPLEYTSPEFDKITPKNSPLWKTKPDLQLYYNASRDWARMYFPDVIMGVYADDELLDAMPGSQAVARPRGIEGLKQQLTRTEDQTVAPADEQPFEADMTESEKRDAINAQDQSTVDQTEPEVDPNQDETAGDPSGPTEAEQREQAASGRTKQKSAFDGHSGVGQ